MHELVLVLGGVGRVPLRRETRQAFLVNVHLERAERRHCRVHAQVVLETVHEGRLVDVTAHDAVVFDAPLQPLCGSRRHRPGHPLPQKGCCSRARAARGHAGSRGQCLVRWGAFHAAAVGSREELGSAHGGGGHAVAAVAGARRVHDLR